MATAAAPKRDKTVPLPRSLTPRGPAATGRVLKFLSLNVAGLRAVLNGDKAKTLGELVERERPDVICLNEHKLKEEDVEECEAKLRAVLPKEYATIHWSCSTAKKGYSGVAILLRHAGQDEGAGGIAIADPVGATVTKGMGEIGKDDPVIAEEGRLLTLELPELAVVAVYVPNSGIDLKRLAYRTQREAEQGCWDAHLGLYVTSLRETLGKPVVVIGDLNCCHRVQDVWNMHDRPDFPEGLAAKPVVEQYTGLSSLKKFAGITPEERNSFPLLLEGADLVDTFRALHPDASGVFSYFSQRVVQNRPLNRGLRLDYVLASSSLCTHLRPRGAAEEEQEQKAAEEEQGQEAAAAAAVAEPPLPRIHESYILDQGELVADHAAVGCEILLPGSIGEQ